MSSKKPSKNVLKSVVLSLFFIAAYFLPVGLAAAADVANAPPFAQGVPENMGCLVCHADPKLKNDRLKQSLYMNKDVMLKSSHKELACQDCHTNYKTKPAEEHEEETKESGKVYAKIARATCGDCHDHEKPTQTMEKSIHGPETKIEGDAKLPDCVDCHGPHDIRNPKKDKKWGKEFKLSGKDVCGQCHPAEYKAFNDYYHGRAYKMSAAGTPACWDCHGTHDIAKVDSDKSRVKGEKLVKTCGQCHDGSSETFVEYAQLIHGRQDMMDNNPVWKYINVVIDFFNNLTASANTNY